MRRLLRSRALSASCFGIVLAACSAVDDAASTDSAVTSSPALFGDDRVGRILRDAPDRAPRNVEELEQLFGIGRACARADSKEVFIIDETGTRDDTSSASSEKALPRSVITGCNPDPQKAEDIAFSYSLMTALVSTTRKDIAPDPDHGDTIVPSPLEVMAFDDTTGVYNFYKFFQGKPGERAIIMRVERTPDDKVFDDILFPGDKAPIRRPAVANDGTPTRRCFGCHVNGAPLMNELEDPWTKWVSFRNQSLDRASFAGRTQSLVDEAIPNAQGRSSFAKGLEDPLKAGMRTYVNGIPGKPDTGYGAAVLNGRAPGGIARLLRSVFCETELNYRSAFDEVPYEMFFDAAVLGDAPPLKAAVNPAEPLPHLLPVRSEMDKRVENFLQRSRILTPNTILAARLLDEENDVFSAARCKVHDAVVKGLPAAPGEVDAHVRMAIQKAAASITDAKRRTLIDKLVDPSASTDDVQAAKSAYVDDVQARYTQKIKLLDTADGRAKLQDEVSRRQRAAGFLFPPPASPLPESLGASSPPPGAAAAPPMGMAPGTPKGPPPSDPHELDPPRKK